MENNKQIKDKEQSLPNIAVKDDYVDAFNLAYAKRDYQGAIEICENAAYLGNKEAQRQLGDIYTIRFDEYGIKCDIKKSVKWYKKASHQNDFIASHRLASIYEEKQNYKEAFKWLGCCLQTSECTYNINRELIRYYEYGLGIDKNHKKAFELANEVNDLAMLSRYYVYGIGVKTDLEKACGFIEEIYLRIISTYFEDFHICNYNKQKYHDFVFLGHELWDSYEYLSKRLMDEESSLEKSFNFLKELVSGGYGHVLEEQVALSFCYKNGIGVKIDHKKAFELAEEAALCGLKDAQVLLATYYQKGVVINHSNEALLWFEKAVLQGFGKAMRSYEDNAYNGIIDKLERYAFYLYKLQNAYLGGKYERIYVSDELDFEWIKEEAETGNELALVCLGLFYTNGIGVKKDYSKGLNLIKKSADNGCVLGGFYLAIYYNRESNRDDIETAGSGDFDLPIKWFYKTIEHIENQCDSMYGFIDVWSKYMLAVYFFQDKNNYITKETAQSYLCGFTDNMYGFAPSYNFSLSLIDINNIIVSELNASALLEYFVQKTKVLEQKEQDLEEVSLKLEEKNTELDIKNEELESEKDILKQTNAKLQGKEKELEATNKALESEIKQKEAAHKALHEKEKEMLSFFTHTMRNALATAPESLRQAIRLLGSEDYEKNQKHYEAINEITSLFSTLSLTDCLIDTFKQSIYDTEEFKRAWQNDTTGEATPQWFIAAALRQSLNRIIFMSNTRDLRKLLHDDPALIKPTRKAFIEQVLPLDIDQQGVELFYHWINSLSAIDVSIQENTLQFGVNQIKFSLLFSITSELILNALKYWSGTGQIQIRWYTEQDYYMFTVKNACKKNASSNLAGTHKGLAFIERLMELLDDKTIKTHSPAQFKCYPDEHTFTAELKLYKTLLENNS